MTHRRPPSVRRWWLAWALSAAALALALAALFAPGQSAYASYVSVDMADFTYFPQSITIQTGGKVSWINKGGVSHNVAAVDGSWDSGDVEPGRAYQQVFTKPGVYRFYSRYYGTPDQGGMTGQVVVVGDSAVSAQPAVPDPNAIEVPPGYKVEVVATGLNGGTSLAINTNGEIYVSETGNPQFGVPGAIKKVMPDGSLSLVAPLGGASFNFPLNGIAFGPDGRLYASHASKISVVNPDGTLTDIITGLPVGGIYSNDHLTFGPDGRLYFGMGTVSDLGVVGPGPEGQPAPQPPIRDIPCRTVTLAGVNYTVENQLTGAYLPLGSASTPGQVVEGAVPCTGAILRANLDGSGLDVVGWGLRNPFGLRFAPAGHPFAGTLMVGNNAGGDLPRFVGGMSDELFAILNPTAQTVATAPWFGWPDYFHGRPVTDSSVFSPTTQLVLQNPPQLSLSALRLAPGAVPGGLDFSTSDSFGFKNDLFVALWGGGRGPNGRPPSVIRVSLAPDSTGMLTPTVSIFAVAKDPSLIDTPGHGGLNHPLDVKFSRSGDAMYVLDFINFTTPGSGTIWRIAPEQATVTPTVTATELPPTGTPTVTATPVAPTTTPTPTDTVAPPTVTATVTTAPPTATVTDTPVPPTATATVTDTPVPPTATATVTDTPVPPTATATVTYTPVPPTVTRTATATPQPTSTTVVCDPSRPGNLCGGIVNVRVFIDFGCNGFFTPGTDFPLSGAVITARLPDGRTQQAVVDVNGNAVLSGIFLGAGEPVEISVDDPPPAPTWVRQSGLDLETCPAAPTTFRLTRSNFGLFGVAFVDFRYTLTEP